MPERVLPNITEYEAVKHVLESKLEGFKWEHDQLLDEAREIGRDPDMGYGCKEYKQVIRELKVAITRCLTLRDILYDLDEDTSDVLNGVWW